MSDNQNTASVQQASQQHAAKQNESDPFGKQRNELIAILIQGEKPLAELPKPLQDPLFLNHMVGSGRIEFGRPAYYRQSDPKTFEEKVMEGKGPPSWTGLGGLSKTLPELLAEEKTMPESIRLRLRLANKAA